MLENYSESYSSGYMEKTRDKLLFKITNGLRIIIRILQGNIGKNNNTMTLRLQLIL